MALVVVVLVLLALVLAAVYGLGVKRKSDALRAAHPDQPWMWREDWARGAIRDTSRGTTIGLWVFTLICNAIAFPITWLARPQVSGENLLSVIIYLFPLAGIIMLLSAIYQTLRSLKFGTSVCHLQRVPIVPGRLFRGEVELKTDVVPVDGYRLRILLVRLVTTRTGRNRSTSERLLWDTEIFVPAEAAMRSPLGTRVPFELATPPDSHPTDDQDMYDRYLWRLSATAQLPGVDYGAQFDIPVFLTGSATDGSEFTAFQARHRVEAAHRELAPASGVEITKLPGGGEEFRIQAKKTFDSMLGGFVFLGLWNAAIYAMIRFHVPWGIPAVFIALDLLFILSTLDYYLGKSTIEVDASGVRVHRLWMGIGSTSQSYEAASIASIDGTTAGANSKSFGVTLKLHDGATRLLGAYLSDRESAEAVAAKMMADLGRN
ncbi:MAG: hypothetical protein ABI837_02285 [Acidobacteriota bacterium]